jgi:hypothetical protein
VATTREYDVHMGVDGADLVCADCHGANHDPETGKPDYDKMKGSQPVDANNNTILVPHLFPGKGGPNAYWKKNDRNLALQDGAAYTGQSYSREYMFATTEILLSVNHEIAPKEMALGAGPSPDNCMDCHVSSAVDFTELGWTADPLSGGERVDGGESVMLDRPAPKGMD